MFLSHSAIAWWSLWTWCGASSYFAFSSTINPNWGKLGSLQGTSMLLPVDYCFVGVSLSYSQCFTMWFWNFRSSITRKIHQVSDRTSYTTRTCGDLTGRHCQIGWRRNWWRNSMKSISRSVRGFGELMSQNGNFMQDYSRTLQRPNERWCRIWHFMSDFMSKLEIFKIYIKYKIGNAYIILFKLEY